MKSFVGYIAGKIVKSLPRSKKVSPDIKSVKPTKLSVSESIKKVKSDEYSKRIDLKNEAEKKLKTGKKMMKEGQEERKKLVDTGRAFKFKRSKSIHAIEPGENPKVKYKDTIEKNAGRTPTKKFKKGKELDREKKMGGGMMGRRFGMKKGTPNPFKKETNVEKIKKTFAPKRKKKFPDLTGDGKVTFADILKGRGVINGKKKKKA